MLLTAILFLNHHDTAYIWRGFYHLLALSKRSFHETSGCRILVNGIIVIPVTPHLVFLLLFLFFF
jgi:hypothetical protein